MSKLIKFDLSCDGNLCRNVDQLRDNFNILDVLAHFKSGKLAKWLKARDLNEHLALLKAINQNGKDISIARQLCSIFNIDAEENYLTIAMETIEYKKISTDNAKTIEFIKSRVNEMTKALQNARIEFDLSCNGNSCRSVDQLRNNFNILDVFAHFKSGKLAKWLKARDLNEHLAHLEAINQNGKDISIARQLCSIFNIDAEENYLTIAMETIEYKKISTDNAKTIEFIKSRVNEMTKALQNARIKLDTMDIKTILIKGQVSEEYTKVLDDDIRVLIVGYKIKGPMKGDDKKTKIIFKDSTDCCPFTFTFQNIYGEEHNVFIKTLLARGLYVKFLAKQLEGTYIELVVIDLDNKLKDY